MHGIIKTSNRSKCMKLIGTLMKFNKLGSKDNKFILHFTQHKIILHSQIINAWIISTGGFGKSRTSVLSGSISVSGTCSRVCFSTALVTSSLPTACTCFSVVETGFEDKIFPGAHSRYNGPSLHQNIRIKASVIMEYNFYEKCLKVNNQSYL